MNRYSSERISGIRSRPINYATCLVHRSLPWGRRHRLVVDRASPSSVVRQPEQTQLDSTQLAIRACLDNLVRSDGNRGLAGVEESRLDRRAHATVPTAAAPQCGLVRDIFSAALSRPGLCRNCNLVVRHPGDIDRILESGSRGRLVTLAVFDLGQLRDSAQLLDMAIKYVITFASTTGILN